MIAWILQIIRLHDWILKRIGRAGMHVAQAFGAMLPNPARHAGILIQHADVTFAIARWREHSLEIRSIQTFVRFPEPMHERGTKRQNVWTPQHPSCDLGPKPASAGQLVHGDAGLNFSDHSDREMVTQILADAW